MMNFLQYIEMVTAFKTSNYWPNGCDIFFEIINTRFYKGHFNNPYDHISLPSILLNLRCIIQQRDYNYQPGA